LKLIRSSLVVAVLPCAALSCSGTTEPSAPPPLQLTPAEAATATAANDFAFALFAQLAKSQAGANVFVSPFSASASLSMAMNGAAGGTLTAMRAALRVNASSLAEVNASYKGLIDQLRSVDPAVTFQTANSIWYNKSFSFKQSFLDTTKRWFSAEVRGLDFSDASGSLAAINGWVSASTNGKIPSILDEVRRDEAMFLINATYFKAPWQFRFNPAGTSPASFFAADGTTQSVPMMTRGEHLSPKFGAGGVGQLGFVELPYGNRAFAMDIVLGPYKANIDSIAATLTSSVWAGLVASLKDVDYALVLPKFTMTYDRTLNDDLTALGMGVAFSDAADFSGMSSTAMALEFVRQKAFVDVNEDGTEAAASTVTGVIPLSLEEIRVDHPFIFAIRERSSGAILFMGKVLRIP